MVYQDFTNLNEVFGIDGLPGVYLTEEEATASTSRFSFSHLPAVRQAISEARKGQVSGFKGRTHTDKSINQMIQNLPDRRGAANPRSRRWTLTYENGSTITIDSLHSWAKERHLQPNSIRNVYYGRSRNYMGIVKVQRD